MGSSASSGDLFLKLVIPFALGAIFTLAITAVNHRRDHIKHVRDVLSSAIQAVSSQGARFWATDYNDEAMVKLRGAVVYLQHVLPYAIDSTHVDEKLIQEMEQLFADISHTALHSEGDLNSDSHAVDIEKVTILSVYCARAEAIGNTMLLESMSLQAIFLSTLYKFKERSAALLKAAHNAMFVP